MKLNKVQITVGVIGAGMISEKHIASFQKTGKVNVTWVADINESLLNEVKAKYSIQNSTKDYHEILKDASVDLVVIATPPKMHFPMLKDCLEANKHVLIEKPAAISLPELNEMLELRKKYPHLLVMDPSCRHARLQPKFSFVKSIIDSGKLGDIYYIHHNSTFRQGRGGIEYHPAAKWFLNKAIAGGGPMLDWGVYDFSFHLGIMGDKPELIEVKSAYTINGLDKVDPGTPIFDVEEHGFALLQFTGGLKYYWERSSNAHVDVPNETRIYGTKGGLKFSFCSWDPTEVEFFDVADDGKGKARSEIMKVDMSKHINDEYHLAEHVVDTMLNGAEYQMPLERAAKHLDIILKVYQAAKN